MTLEQAILWAIVEAQADKPDYKRIREVLMEALPKIMEHDLRAESLARLAKVWGDK